ncbi:hypothetical protein [Sphingomonas pokkalii]|uniref:hypothetical protein n=1 Tax=Sphingomonas pokkalii TaxID=2175090 RepID=UPI001403752A|nr:hypothetical protein [Sphingomonas pokkalii]
MSPSNGSRSGGHGFLLAAIGGQRIGDLGAAWTLIEPTPFAREFRFGSLPPV